ncbi:uncharacterized protein [Watersipora subatra]|uniref:uncharacterized protein isoform X2 n=1 Tax=Watersipora subatra TaxID=2589382 RepID=UPI00355BF454
MRMLSICLLLLFPTFKPLSGSDVSKDAANNFIEDYYDFRLRENPGYALDHGIAKYQDQVEEWNYAAFDRRKMESEDLYRRVNSLLEDGVENRDDELSLKIIQFNLRKYIEGSAYLNYTVTVNGNLAAIANQITFEPIDSVEELRRWYKKVIAYQSVFADQIGLLDVGLQSRLTQAQLTVQKYVTSYKAAIGDSFDNFFAFKPWKDLNIETSNRTFYDEGKEECEKLRQQMENFVNKLENDYLPQCRDINHAGLSSLPGGDKFYEATLQYYTSDETTSEIAHQLGLDEVDRISVAMQKIIRNENFQGTIRDFVNTLYQDPNEYFSTQSALKQGYKDMLNKQVRPKLGKEFNPEPPIALELIDDPYGSLGVYNSPKWNGTGWTPGIFIYDGSKPTEMLKITMLAVLVHEALPGHHYQLASVLLTDLPDFRKYSEYAHHDQGAYNVPYHGAYIEGWGLYSEYISEVMGIISTDREKLGRLSLESLRASRLVVDTGIHHYK